MFKKPLYNYAIDWNHPLSRGLVGAWILDDKGGGYRFYDLTGNNDGVRVGSSVTQVATPDGVGVNFNGDGTTDRINLGSIDSSNPLSCNVNNEVSIIAKVYYKSGATNDFPRIFDKSSSGLATNGYNFNIYSVNGELQLYVAGGQSIRSTSLVPTNQWSTLAILSESGNNDFYIDREDAGIFTGTDRTYTIPTTTTNAAIGHWNHATTDREFHGDMEYVFVYDRKISEAEYFSIENEAYQFITDISLLTQKSVYSSIFSEAATVSFQAAWAKNNTIL